MLMHVTCVCGPGEGKAIEKCSYLNATSIKLHICDAAASHVTFPKTYDNVQNRWLSWEVVEQV